METASSFYSDWSFWAVIVAGLAILLSQIPPLHVLFKRAKLDVELYSKIAITHKVGKPDLQLHLALNNIGGRKIRIKNVDASISRDGKNVATLPAQNYLQNQNDQNTLLLTPFSLAPNQEWEHIINFLNFFGRDDEKTYRDIEGKMLADFREKKKPEGESTPQALVEHPNVLVESAVKLFEKHFIWNAGEYEMAINVITDKTSANVTKKYRFTVFESQSEQLKDLKEQYKYGGFIWWDPQKIPTNVMLEISED